MYDEGMRMNDVINYELKRIRLYYYKLNILYNTDNFSVIKLHLVNNKKSINRIFAYCSDGNKRFSISYPRLLLQIKVGRLLGKDETCDHIDNNSLNNKFVNLQALSRVENARKGSSLEVKKKNAKLTSERMTGVEQPYNQGERNKTAKLTNAQVLEIKELQKSYVKGSGQDKVIAKQYGVSRSTIKGIRLGYWRIKS